MIFLLLPPPNEIWGKGNIFTSVCLSTGRGVMMSLPVINGTHPRQYSLQTATPQTAPHLPDSSTPLYSTTTSRSTSGQYATGMLSCSSIIHEFLHCQTLILDQPLNNPPYLLNRITIRIAIRTRNIRAPKTPRRMSVVPENKRCTLSSCSISV